MISEKRLMKAVESSSDMIQAAGKLGISRNTLYYYLNKYNLKSVKQIKLVKRS